ncbi:MAG: quinone oxidoreductase family protein [Acidobacteriaceae bacterium]
MNAAVIQAFDAPPAYASFADPTPSPGETLVDVSAAALHRIVRSLANGSHYGSTGVLPFVPGVDGVGRLRSSFGRLPAGARVFFGAARSPFGTFAEQSLASANMLIPLPDALDDATAAAIANPAMSSAAALLRARFHPGENILILGATGASGRLAVRIAKAHGAGAIVAVGRNPQALQSLKSLGADATISLNQNPDALLTALRSELTGKNIDIILDYLWGPPAETLLSAIAEKGLQHSARRIRYVQIGNIAGPTLNLAASTLRSSGLELLGSGFGSASLDQIREAITVFFAMIAVNPVEFKYKIAPLREIGSHWNVDTQGARLVFQP